MKYSWKGHKDRKRHKNRIKEWASLVGLRQKSKPQHPHHVKVSPRVQFEGRNNCNPRTFTAHWRYQRFLAGWFFPLCKDISLPSPSSPASTHHHHHLLSSMAIPAAANLDYLRQCWENRIQGRELLRGAHCLIHVTAVHINFALWLHVSLYNQLVERAS